MVETYKASEIAEFLKIEGDNKRLYITIRDTVYRLYVSEHAFVNIRNYAFLKNSVTLREYPQVNGGYSSRILVACIERMENVKISAIDIGAIENGNQKSQSSFELNSAVLAKFRFRHEIDALERAVCELLLPAWTKYVPMRILRFMFNCMNSQTPSFLIYVYLKMYATKLFSIIEKNTLLRYEMIGDLPIGSEMSYFVAW